MTAQHWTDALHALNACDAGLDWAGGYDSLDSAWAACERGDWMLWLAGRVAGPPGDDSRRPLVLAACAYAAAAADAAAGNRVATLRQCADLVREYYPTPPTITRAQTGEDE
jgi:hypothetical protein